MKRALQERVRLTGAAVERKGREGRKESCLTLRPLRPLRSIVMSWAVGRTFGCGASDGYPAIRRAPLRRRQDADE